MEKSTLTNHHAVKKKQAIKFINKLLMEKSNEINQSTITDLNNYLSTQDEISNAMLFINHLEKPD